MNEESKLSIIERVKKTTKNNSRYSSWGRKPQVVGMCLLDRRKQREMLGGGVSFCYSDSPIGFLVGALALGCFWAGEGKFGKGG